MNDTQRQIGRLHCRSVAVVIITSDVRRGSLDIAAPGICGKESLADVAPDHLVWPIQHELVYAKLAVLFYRMLTAPSRIQLPQQLCRKAVLSSDKSVRQDQLQLVRIL